MYTRIDELIWKDAKLKKISNESKLLFIYLLSCQHRNVLGLYNLPKYYVQGDLGYPLETVSKGLAELFINGFITYDDESETVLVNNFLKYNPLENANQVTGALKVMKTIPKTQLFYKLVDVIESSENERLGELKIGIEDYLESNGFERVIQTVTITVPEQEEEEEEVKEEVSVSVKEEVTEKVKEKNKKISVFSSDIAEIVDHLNKVLGTNYRATTKATQDVIKARLKEKYVVDDFKYVIDIKYDDWHGDSKTEPWLRPSTLFGNKFESYLNQKKPNKNNNNVLITNNPFLKMEMEGVFDDDE